MELVYLWVEDYLNIKNCGFNINSRFSVAQDNNEKAKQISLEIESNPNFIENFFGNNIVNVTGIVGANGVGKSNFLDYLKIFLIERGFDEEQWLAIYFDSDKKKLKIIHSFFESTRKKDGKLGFLNEWAIVVKNNSAFKLDSIEKAHVGHYPLPDSYYSGKRVKINSRVVYYSPFLDHREFRYLKTFENNYLDISTNNLIFQDSENHPVDRNRIEIYKHKNIERQFLFVQNNRQFLTDINFPTEIEVRFIKDMSSDIRRDDLGYIVKDFYDKFRSSATSKWNSGPNKLISDGQKRKSNKLIEQGRRWKFKWWFVINLVTNFLYNISSMVDLHDENFKVDRNLKGFDFKNDDIVLLAKKFFESQTYVSKKDFNFTSFIDYVCTVIDNDANVMTTFDDNDAYFYVSAEKGKDILEYHMEYLSVWHDDLRRRGFLEINWRDISSGEKSFLDVFSRLYFAIDTLQKQATRSKLIYILLDEGDAGFHPEWQKKYIDYVTSYLRSIPDLQFYIIITTHSPFIASDLPIQNLILLEKSENGTCRVQKNLNTVSQTFGANIHALLADAFFMKEGLMGAFAYAKISEIIAFKKKDVVEKKEYIKKILAIIGEPLIRLKLMEKYAEELGEEYEIELLTDEMSILQQRINNLKSKGNDSNQR